MEVVKQELTVILSSVREKLTIKNLILYLIEGLAITFAAYVIPNKKTQINEIIIIALMAAISFFMLDVFSETVGTGSRIGAGFGIGYNLVNLASPIRLPFM